MTIAVAILASIAFIVWLIYRAIRQKSVRAHSVCYGLATLSGVYAFAFFLEMDIHILFKIILSIIVGAALIVFASYIQRRRAEQKQA